jgi:general secretion pathway protein G
VRKGFTLIELIVVIAIIAVLAAIIAPNAFRAIEKAKISASLEDFRSIKTAIMSYYADTGQWVTDQPPGDLLTDPGVANWDGPYIEQWPASDRWGGAYDYRNGQLVNWDGQGANDFARHLELPNVPLASADKIDAALDGVASVPANKNTLGQVRWTVGATEDTTVQILISTNVAVAN